MVDLPSKLEYPIIAIGDLHGQREELEGLIERLEELREWPNCAIVFLGDFVDRGPDVRGTIDLVLELLRRTPGGSAVMGNHDLALVRAARLDGGPESPYWIGRYKAHYNAGPTFEAYLGPPALFSTSPRQESLDFLREAMPDEHRNFLASLPWVVEATGHLFLHNGLSDELQATPEEQVEALRSRRWDRSLLNPISGTKTDALWEDEYPAWLGADRRLAVSPRRHPGQVQVTGHEQVARPDTDETRIRLDTSGGCGTLTGCLLRSAEARPVFVTSR